MKKSTLTALLTSIAFLVVCCFFTNGYARTNNLTETVRGKIEMGLPDAPAPKVEIDLDKSLLGLFINFGIASNPKLAGDGSIDLSEYAAYAEMLKGVSIRVYDQEMQDLDGMVTTIGVSLKTKSGNISSKSGINSISVCFTGKNRASCTASSLCSPMMAIRAL